MTRALAVVGAGSIGARYCRWLAELGHSVFVVDADPEAAQRAASESGGTAIALDEVRPPRVSGVIVATPPSSHRRVAERIVAAGLPCLIEKPLAANLEDAEAILHLGQQAGARLAVVCNMRFHPGPQTIAANLGRIGRPLFARAHFGHRLSQMRPGRGVQNLYAASAEEGGGAILDCIHEIDLQQSLFGLGTLEAAAARKLLGEVENVEDYAELVVAFPSGVRAAIHLDLLQRAKLRGWEVAGTEGTLIWRSVGRAPEICTVEFLDAARSEVLLKLDSVDAAAPYKAMLRKFLEEIDGDARATGLQSLAQAVNAMRIAEEGRRSFEAGAL